MQQFGFQSGDKFLTMDGEKVEDLQRIGMEILIFDHRNFTVQHKDGSIQKIKLPVDIGSKMWENNVEAGAFDFRSHMSIITKVEAKSTAAKAGLKKGDRILQINEQVIEYHDEFLSAIYQNKGKQIDLVYERGNDTLSKTVKLAKEGPLGVFIENKITTDTSAYFTRDYSIGEAFAFGIGKGMKTMYSNVAQFKYVFTSKGASSVGGFGSIGKMFPPVWDWRAFWTLTAFISMMLAVMNMLPIPALDGGHVMFLGLPAAPCAMRQARRMMTISAWL
jgi:regulator of sigma E protease